ncbi:MAG: hypothetical protein ACOH2J_17395 [Allorhizobium sp.]
MDKDNRKTKPPHNDDRDHGVIVGGPEAHKNENRGGEPVPEKTKVVGKKKGIAKP